MGLLSYDGYDSSQSVKQWLIDCQTFSTCDCQGHSQHSPRYVKQTTYLGNIHEDALRKCNAEPREMTYLLNYQKSLIHLF